MAGYFNSAGSSIGSLLRFIQEQKSGSPISAPSAQSGSPIRDVTQNPLQGSEGIGSSRTVSLRPEGVLTPSGQPVEQGAPQSSRFGPISIGGGPGNGAPTSNRSGIFGDTGISAPGIKAEQPGASAPVSQPTLPSASQPSIATSIKGPSSFTNPGMQNIQANLSRGITGVDTTTQKVKDAIASGYKSLSEFDANTAAAEEAARKSSEDIQKQLDIYEGRVYDPNNPISRNLVAQAKAELNKGSTLGASTSAPKTSMTTPGMSYNKPTPKVNYTPAAPVNITPATKGLTVQTPQKTATKAPAKAPSLGTSVGNALATLRKMFGF